jgi:hypothetical protein
MNKLAALPAILLLASTAVPALADHPGSATSQDIQRVQADLYNLEEAVRNVSPDNPRYAEFKTRTDEIREDVTYLRVQIRRHHSAGAGAVAAGDMGASLEDVSWVREQIRALNDDVLGATNRRWSTGAVTVPAETEMQVRLDTPLSSRTARPEDRFEGTVMMPVYVADRMVVGAGARVRGTVVSAEPANRPIRGGKLDLAFNTLELEDNTRADVHARVVSLSESIDRNESGQKAGMGAALGALLGSVIGGKKGALLGILVGGAGGAITSKGEEVDLPEGTILTLRTDRPIHLRR